MAEDLQPIKQVIQIDVKETGVDEATKDVGKLNTTISGTATENKKVEESFKSLKVQLREAIQLQQKMSAQYGSTSEQAIKATKAVAGIKDEIGFQKDLVASYNPDEKFRKLTQTAGVAALALGGVKDGFTALGIESKTLDKIIGSAQAILGVTSAVAGMSDAYQILTASKKAKSAADVVEAGTTEALVVVEGQATAATWSWNAALLANPIVLITAGIIAAGAAIYAFVKITDDAVKEEEKAKVASMQLTQAIDKQAQSFENNNKYAKAGNSHKIDLLRASGASEAQIYKETKALAEQELQLAKNYRAQAIVAEQKAYEANRDNPTEFNAETLKKAQENIEKAKTAVSVGYDGLIALQNSHEIAVVQAQTDAANKALEKQKADQEKALQAQKDANAKKLEEQKKFNEDVLKEQQEMNLRRVEQEIQEGLDEKVRKDEAIQAAFEAGDKAQEDLEIQKQKDIDSDKAVVEQKKANQDLLISQGENLIANVARLAGKNKAIQKAAIIAEGGVSVGKAVVNTSEAVTKDLAKGFPFSTPLVALDLAVGATSVASIIKGTSDALKSVGGGSFSGGSGGGAQSLPTRNVAQVGFQGSSENQISTAIAQQQKEQPPIQAFVVSQALTDQQELDRKKELNNSF